MSHHETSDIYRGEIVRDGRYPVETADLALTPKETARRLLFLLAEAAEQQRQENQDVESESSKGQDL